VFCWVAAQVHEPVSKFSLELLPVSTVMRSPVVTLELHMKVRGQHSFCFCCCLGSMAVASDAVRGHICRFYCFLWTCWRLLSLQIDRGSDMHVRLCSVCWPPAGGLAHCSAEYR
jgi:hypothetical protein